MINGSNQQQLVIKRYLEGSKACAITRCCPASLTILADETGVEAREYYQAFHKPGEHQHVQLEYDGRPLIAADCAFVGFDEKLPNETLAAYLAGAGMGAEEIERCLGVYELKKQSFLLCSQLPHLPARQLQLLAVLCGTKKVVVLSDPFLPFNGRWREAFGEMVLERCREKNLIVLCLNLSFMPRCWEQQSGIRLVDLAEAAEEAVRRLAKPALPKAEAVEALDKAVAAAGRNEQYYRAAIKIPLPENVVFAYRQVGDWLFEPLARLSNFLRQWSSLTSVTVIVLLVVIGAFVMFPNLTQSRQLLLTLANRFSEPPPATSDSESEPGSHPVQAAATAAAPVPSPARAGAEEPLPPKAAPALEDSAVPQAESAVELAGAEGAVNAEPAPARMAPPGPEAALSSLSCSGEDPLAEALATLFMPHD